MVLDGTWAEVAELPGALQDRGEAVHGYSGLITT
jgi:hypothetical protein